MNGERSKWNLILKYWGIYNSFYYYSSESIAVFKIRINLFTSRLLFESFLRLLFEAFGLEVLLCRLWRLYS